MHSDCAHKRPFGPRVGERALTLKLERSLILQNDLADNYAGFVDVPANYTDVPEDLLRLARSYPVRGQEFGIAGNVRAVAYARDFLAKKIMSNVPIPEDWMEIITLPEGSIEDLVTDDFLRYHYCPRCMNRF